MRLDKFLSHAGYGSRKEVKQLLKKKAVTVNDKIVKDGKYDVDEVDDIVSIKGEVIPFHKDLYWMLYKPTGVITATEDAHQRTVMDLLAPKDCCKNLFPVGRLDKDTTGLLLLTTNGPLGHALLSPKKHVDKEYYATIQGIVTDKEVHQFKQGIQLDGGDMAKPAQLSIQSIDKEKGQSKISLCIQEGKYHQVKRMFQAVGMKVLTLHRHRMADLVLDETLRPGQYRALTEDEVQLLLEKGGL